MGKHQETTLIIVFDESVDPARLPTSRLKYARRLAPPADTHTHTYLAFASNALVCVCFFVYAAPYHANSHTYTNTTLRQSRRTPSRWGYPKNFGVVQYIYSAFNIECIQMYSAIILRAQLRIAHIYFLIQYKAIRRSYLTYNTNNLFI